MNFSDLRNIRRKSLLNLLRLYKKANAGHIGSSLSCLDILLYLYFYKMNPEDKFILSKGHAALAWYVTLYESGKISLEELETYYKDGTFLAAHPPTNRKIKDIVFGTGSLGHGLSLSSGLALASQLSGKKFNVYCVLSDGDCNEGSTWEAALFAGHHGLSNLTVIIDQNELQGFGECKDVLDLDPFQKKWEAFNFETVIAENGNLFESLDRTFSSLNVHSSKPKCIIAKTAKGHGVSFMENKLEWHYLPMTDEQYNIAIDEINRNA